MIKEIVWTFIASVAMAVSVMANSLNVSYGTQAWQKADIYPSAISSSPIIVMIHGGGWVAGDKSNLTGLAQDMQGYGYTVMNINYEIATATVASYPQTVTDCTTAISFIKANASSYSGDPNKVIVFGSSAGAQLSEIMANNAATNGVKANIAFYGAAELYDPVLGANHQNGMLISDTITEYLGATLASNPTLWHDASPYDHVTSSTAPTAFWHDYGDSVVPVQQSLDMYDTLQSLHIFTQITTVPGYSHGFLTNSAANAALFEPAIAGFLHSLGL